MRRMSTGHCVKPTCVVLGMPLVFLLLIQWPDDGSEGSKGYRMDGVCFRSDLDSLFVLMYESIQLTFHCYS